jgi:hypothetical protein
VAIPALAASVPSDAKLLQLCRNYLRLERVENRLCLAADKAEQEAWAKEAQRKSRQKPPPPRPEALKGDLVVWPEATGPFGLVDLERENLRETLSKIADGTYTIFACFLPGTDRKSMKGVAPPEAARAKARELIAIYEDWAARGGDSKPKRSRRTAAQVKADKALERLYKKRRQPLLPSRFCRRKPQQVSGQRCRSSPPIPCTLMVATSFGSEYPPLVAIGASLVRDIQRIELSARLTPPIAV